jgi:phage baseplate assembly protein W
MSENYAQFGTDLRLLRDLERGHSRDPGHDLGTVPVERWPRQLLKDRDREIPKDLETLSGVDNLKQALLLRFLTPAGDLAPLGHPTYGCRLHELIGELNTQTTRNRAKLYVLQALGEEPRVKQVLGVEVTPNPKRREQIDIQVRLIAIDGQTPLNLVFPFLLEGGLTRA